MTSSNVGTLSDNTALGLSLLKKLLSSLVYSSLVRRNTASLAQHVLIPNGRSCLVLSTPLGAAALWSSVKGDLKQASLTLGKCPCLQSLFVSSELTQGHRRSLKTSPTTNTHSFYSSVEAEAD